MTEPISIQWPSADILRFGKRADAGSEAVNITKGTDNIELSVWNTYECISIAGSNSGASSISMYGADESGIQLEATTSHTSKLSMYGNSVDPVLELNTNSDSTASIDLLSGSNDCIAIRTGANATSSIKLSYNNNDCILMQTATNSTGEFVICGDSEWCARITSSADQTGHIALFQGGDAQLEIDTNADKTSSIRMYYDNAENILAETRTDNTAIITMKNNNDDCISIESLPEGLAQITMLNEGDDCISLESLPNHRSKITMYANGDDCIYIEGIYPLQSKITLLNDSNERIYIGTERDDNDVEHNYIEVEHERSGYYTGFDEQGLLLPTKFSSPSSTVPNVENDTRIEAFDSDFLSYANDDAEKIQYLKQTIPSSYAVSKAIQSIQPFNIYPFEFVITDVDADGNAEFKIRYYYQDGTNRYRDFTLNYADKQGSPSTAFDAQPTTLSGIDLYVSKLNQLMAGGSGSIVIADESFSAQRTLVLNYNAAVPVDIEFKNCTFTGDSLVSLFAAVAGQDSPVNFSVKFTDCDCSAITSIRGMFANLIDTTRLSIDGLEVTAVTNIERLFVYLGARTDGCDLVINNCDFGTVKQYVSDIFSWSKIKEIDLESIGLTDQTIDIITGGSVATNIGSFSPNCDEAAILPYYKPLSSFTVYGKIPRDYEAKPARTDGFLNWPYNFIARDYEVGGHNELRFDGTGMNDAPATVRNQYYTIRLYTVNELVLGSSEDGGPYPPGTTPSTLGFNYPENVSGVTVSPKIERFGVYFDVEAAAASSGITRIILMNGSTEVAVFDDITYSGPNKSDATHAIMYNGQNFIDYFNAQNYSFTLNNGDVYLKFKNPTVSVSSYEFSGILSSK